jgi:hypothetical protein
MKFFFLNAFFATALGQFEADNCGDPSYFVDNYLDCMAAMKSTANTANEETEVEEPNAEEIPEGFAVAVDDEDFSSRAADLSGCGVHRTCSACRDLNANQCYWNPGTGCVKRFNNAPNVCTAQNQVAPQCSAFKDCNSCTIQNGCVFYRGTCTYSRGSGCISDPQNCVNYEWNCPAKPPVEVLVPQYQAPYAPPPPAAVQVQTPDRISQTVTRVEDMIIGMSAMQLRSLRNELNAVLIAAEEQAIQQETNSYNAPYFQQQVYQVGVSQGQPSVPLPGTTPSSPYSPYATVLAPSVFGENLPSYPASFGSQSSKPQNYFPSFVTPTYSTDDYMSFFQNSMVQTQVQPSNPWAASSKPQFSWGG